MVELSISQTAYVQNIYAQLLSMQNWVLTKHISSDYQQRPQSVFTQHATNFFLGLGNIHE